MSIGVDRDLAPAAHRHVWHRDSRGRKGRKEQPPHTRTVRPRGKDTALVVATAGLTVQELAINALWAEAGMDLTIQYADCEVEGRTVKVAHRGTPTDAAIIDVVFKHRQFYPNIDRADALMHDYERIVESGNTPLIVDAGANIGTSTIWFAETFPQAHVVAIEPDDENFVLLAMNSQGRWIDLRKGAVGAKNGVGSLVDPGRGPLGFMMSDYTGGRPTLRWSIDNIIEEKLAIGMEPFIFKCDIEGGERETFVEGEKWVNRFYLVVIEPHDWMLPGQGTFANFLRSVGSFPRDFVLFGENVFSYRNS